MAGNVRRIQPNRAASRKAPIYIDYLMLFCVFLLVVFGLLMLYSCTAYKSHFDELVGQFIAFLVGIVALVVVRLAMVVVIFWCIESLWL